MGMGGPAQPHLGLSSHPHHVGPGTPGKLRSGLLVPAWSQLCLAVIRLCLMCYQHWDCPWLVDQLLSLTSDLLITTNLPEFLPQQNLASISGPVPLALQGHCGGTAPVLPALLSHSSPGFVMFRDQLPPLCALTEGSFPSKARCLCTTIQVPLFPCRPSHFSCEAPPQPFLSNDIWYPQADQTPSTHPAAMAPSHQVGVGAVHRAATGTVPRPVPMVTDKSLNLRENVDTSTLVAGYCILF